MPHRWARGLLTMAVLASCNPPPVDKDGDGASPPKDCDDSRAAVRVGEVEICDGIDNNCDGQIDEGLTTDWYADVDGDGFGDPETAVAACWRPLGMVSNADDCDDTAPDAFPGGAERCDGIDNDCDAEVDEDDSLDAIDWYVDSDGDGFGASDQLIRACEAPDGAVIDPGDCDDTRGDVSPGADEVCDGADNDCDGSIDEADAVDSVVWYVDADGDGFGADRFTVTACAPPDGFVLDGADCDDSDATISPGADELCDAVDNDCDGDVDESDAIDASAWFADSDGDGAGDPDVGVVACEVPSGHVADSSDCDDSDASIYTGAPEFCDGVDHDCDGDTLEDDSEDASVWYGDGDGDGFGDASVMAMACDAPSGSVSDNTDCDDADASVSPAAVEVWYDGVDQDCLGDDDFDADGDGWASLTESPSGRDCDDAEATINPDAEETCGNGIDDDCDGTALGCIPAGDSDVDSADVVVVGDVSDGGLGESLAMVEDVDGDGIDDLLLGAPDAGAGVAYVVLGGVSGTVAASASSAALAGDAVGDAFGTSVSSLGDVDGDGFGDVAVGAPYAEGMTGAAYVFAGPLSGAVGVADALAVFEGQTLYARTGASLADVGDIDADGEVDLVVGAPVGSVAGGSATGVVWLLLGPLSGTLSPDDALVLSGDAAWDAAGESVSTAGDLDGDGFGDLLVGLPGHDAGGASAGAAAVVYGPVLADIELADADAILTGTSADEWAGRAVGAAGDVDGDGLGDILIGAPGLATTGSGAGAAYLVRGPVSGTTSLSAASATLYGESAGDAAGWSVAGRGDFDQDGFADVLVGAPGRDVSLGDAGQTYVVYGPMTGAFALSNADARIAGTRAAAGVGRSISTGRDVDGDGTTDLLVGAPGDASAAPAGGAAHLILVGGL